MRVILLLLCFVFTKIDLNSQIIINEVNIAGNWVELYNAGTTINISGYTLCNFPHYSAMTAGDIDLISGDFMMEAGSFTVVTWDDINVFVTRGELGLYEVFGNFGSVTNIQDYMQWGTANQGRSGTAVGAGIWDNASTFLSIPTNPSNSLSLVVGTFTSGDDTDSMDWEERTPTQGAVNNLQDQIIINEVNIAGDRVELYNAGTTTIDIANYTLCNFPSYAEVSSSAVTLISGSIIMAPGDITVVQWANNISSSGEMGLYEVRGMYTSTSNIQDYVQWGTGNHQRSGTAVSAGVWDSASNYIPAPSNTNNSISLVVGTYNSGLDSNSTNWEEQAPTLGMANASTMANCPVDQDISGIIPQDTFYASNNIMSNGTVAMGDTVLFVAGNEIMLNGGFEVELSGLFEASIGACP